jgi:hypothetical protein
MPLIDRLQELLHDDRGPIQNSAGFPRDPSRPMDIGNRISRYEGHHQTTDMPCLLPSTNRTLDPIDRLPPELSTLFIKNALPWDEPPYRESNSPSRIIELTTVSKGWQSFLCSTPGLWNELIIDERKEDFLATLSVFVALSGNVALQLTFIRQPIDWTGLASLLLPVAQRITSVSFEGGDGLRVSWISSVIPTVFGRLGHLPQLQEVNFDRFMWVGGYLLQAASLLLPSTVKLRGDFPIVIPAGCWKGGAPGRFFDIIKYTTFPPSEPIAPFSNSFNLGYSVLMLDEITISIRSNDTTLSELNSLAERLAEHTCFEQAVYTTTRYLQHLDIFIFPSQVRDAIDCLRLLMRLQTLKLNIQIEDHAKTLSWAPDDTACRTLRVFSVGFQGYYVLGIAFSAQRALRNLFSAFQTLYPSVEEFSLDGNTWPFFISSYLQSLRALKLLTLRLTDSEYKPPKESINLPSLQCLRIHGLAYLDSLHMPNLLKLELTLDFLRFRTSPAHLSHPRIRSLSISSFGGTSDFKLISRLSGITQPSSRYDPVAGYVGTSITVEHCLHNADISSRRHGQAVQQPTVFGPLMLSRATSSPTTAQFRSVD